MTWDKILDVYILIDQAIKDRAPEGFVIGTTRTGQKRAVAITPYLMDKLAINRDNQRLIIIGTIGYNRNANLVVADTIGNVPDLNYIRKYMRRLSARADAHYIPPENPRNTYISLMNDIGAALPVIQ